jgi:hypothetical protein
LTSISFRASLRPRNQWWNLISAPLERLRRGANDST